MMHQNVHRGVKSNSCKHAPAAMHWVERAESACEDLPSFIDDGERITMRASIYEDHFACDPEIPEPVARSATHVALPSRPGLAETLRRKRVENYHADVWWPSVSELGIGLTDQLMIDVGGAGGLRAALAGIVYPAFLRSERGSPKDVRAPPVLPQL